MGKYIEEDFYVHQTLEVAENGVRLATIHVDDADEAIRVACKVHPKADPQNCTAKLIEIKGGVMPTRPLAKDTFKQF